MKKYFRDKRTFSAIIQRPYFGFQCVHLCRQRATQLLQLLQVFKLCLFGGYACCQSRWLLLGSAWLVAWLAKRCPSRKHRGRSRRVSHDGQDNINGRNFNEIFSMVIHLAGFCSSRILVVCGCASWRGMAGLDIEVQSKFREQDRQTVVWKLELGSSTRVSLFFISIVRTISRRRWDLNIRCRRKPAGSRLPKGA